MRGGFCSSDSYLRQGSSIKTPVHCVSVLFCGFTLATAVAGAGEQRPRPLETVTVVGVAPVPDQGLALELVPSNVQVAASDAIDRSYALDFTQYLNRSVGSVFINEAQNNPLQPDVQFRGFTASPLLGLPQGMAMYQDGVRINEPFGDTVNWALVPDSAIAGVTLTPGSNPVFGMNALGGALAVRTKNGFTHPGARAEVLRGAFSRTTAQAEFGAGRKDGLAYFVTGSYFDEDGWRDFSPSRATQVFADLRYRTASGSLGLSLTNVDTNLIGNGPAPVQLLQEDRQAIFTRPDQTENDLAMLNLNGSYELSQAVSITGVAYHRRSRIDTLNGDDSPFEQCDDTPALLCAEDAQIVLDQNGDAVIFGSGVSGATLNRSATNQTGRGAALQATSSTSPGGRKNHFTAGISVDRSQVSFRSSTELGALDDTRAAEPSGTFAREAFVDLRTRTDNHGVYFTNTFEITPRLSVNAAARYNDVEIELRDQLGTELNGDHGYSRFNPAAGITYRPSAAVQFYASAGEASRAPSPAELTCADEDDPCRLPNAFLSDPPLEQVVSRSIEAGVRGALSATRWHLGAFRTTNRDDIIFISAGALTNEGYFDNVGRTRRQGIELNLSGSLLDEQLSWFAHYTALEAIFEDEFPVASANNPQAIDDEIPVEAGDRIPGVPEHLFKLGIDYAIAPRWSIGADFSHASSQYLRGDEGNLSAPVDGHSVLNLRASFAATDQLSVFAAINNLLDEDYETFGVFGEPDEVLGENYEDARFLSPGAPRAVWFGVKLSL